MYFKDVHVIAQHVLMYAGGLGLISDSLALG